MLTGGKVEKMGTTTKTIQCRRWPITAKAFAKSTCVLAQVMVNLVIKFAIPHFVTAVELVAVVVVAPGT